MKYFFLSLIALLSSSFAKEYQEILLQKGEFYIMKDTSLFCLSNNHSKNINLFSNHSNSSNRISFYYIEKDTIVYNSTNADLVKTYQDNIKSNYDISFSKKSIAKINRESIKVKLVKNRIGKEAIKYYSEDNLKMLIDFRDSLVLCEIKNDSAFYKSKIPFSTLRTKIQYDFQNAIIYFSNSSGIYFCSSKDPFNQKVIVKEQNIKSFAVDVKKRMGYFLSSNDEIYKFDFDGKKEKFEEQKYPYLKIIWDYISTNPLISSIFSGIFLIIALFFLKRNVKVHKPSLSNKTENEFLKKGAKVKHNKFYVLVLKQYRNFIKFLYSVFEILKKIIIKQPMNHLPTIVILTAIKEEYMAVRNHLNNISDVSKDDTSYESGIFKYKGKRIANIIIRECGAKNTNASQETERAIHNFEPVCMFFTGIAGSRKPNDFSLGDAIFPEKIYSYEGGKSERKFSNARPDFASTDYSLLEIVKKERLKEDWKQLVKNNGSDKIKVDIGIIASGEQIVEHYNSAIGKILTKNYNDASVVDMESFGFAKAANRQGQKNKNMLIGVVRGISDIIGQSEENRTSNNNRPTEIKKIAAENAAAFTYWLIIKHLSNT